MIIENDKVVTFHYRLKNEEGEELERSEQDQPALYLHGHPGMLPGIVNAMAGKQKGDNYTVTLNPEEGYGALIENAKERVSIKNVSLPGQEQFKGRLQPGTIVEVKTKEGVIPAIVIKMGLKTVDVDTNHPLAGQTLIFDIEIADVRDGTDGEISHGHAHGPGGHEH